MKLQIWFEFASTYSYLSVARIEALIWRTQVELEWRPFLLGPIFNERGLSTSPFVIDPVKGNDQKAQLVIDATNMAVAQRKPDSVIHQSDQGSQYTSVAFGLRCKEMGVRSSIGSRSVTAMTMRCARVSSPHSNARCSTAESSRPRLKRV